MMDPVEGLPPSVRVGPYDITIELKPPDWSDGDDEMFGEYISNTHVLRFRRGLPSVKFVVDTVTHEIFHAIYDIYGLKSRDGEERVVRQMATGWTQVLTDNPKLVAWLNKSLRSARTKKLR